MTVLMHTRNEGIKALLLLFLATTDLVYHLCSYIQFEYGFARGNGTNFGFYK